MTRECEERGVRILCRNTAKKILIDEKWNISGILTEANGKTLNITAKSIIIAAGGFGANHELLVKYCPEVFVTPGHVHCNGVPQATGDGILMAAEAGAMEDDQVGVGFIGPHHYPWSMSLNLLLRRPHVMLVNKRGERYIGSPCKGGNNALNRQPEKVCYALLDSDLLHNIILKRDL